MGDHMVLCVDRLISPESFQTLQGAEVPKSSGGGSCRHMPNPSTSIDMKDVEEHGGVDEEELLIQMVECRICQEEDSFQNLEIPCACNGSLKFAHRKCVQRWCDEKGDIICEICHQPYQPGYTAPPPVPCSEDITIDISGVWTISGSPLDLHDPRLLAMATAERHLLATEYDDYDANASGSAFYRFAALILMALLLLRHSLTISNGEDDDDASTFFSLLVLRAAGFLLPCYIIIWAIGIWQRRKQRQEAEAAAAAEVAFVIQGVQRRGLEFAIPVGLAPPLGPPMSPLQEPVQ
ncbi:hypothetical protein RHGRI_034825 [Rhododendron griersonianum]|uniref:RING-CH-type domain-containing protein n=1 Tax=Rhododendron griersonianum TaxID=479676 RepID=A0AAV6I501_9ERIC|nr:hypothetical protein RHGRI_034825 [Rhododendron griersonianum]